MGEAQRALEIYRRALDEGGRGSDLEQDILSRIDELERRSALQRSSPSTSPSASGNGGEGLILGAAIGYGVAGLGLVSTTIFGSLALANYGSIQSGCGASVSCSESQVADVRAFGLVADIGLVVAGVGVIAGTILLALGLSAGGSAGRAAWLLRPVASLHGAGLLLQGGF